MKPLKLELQAFGPFVEKQVIDFEKLSEKGMFLIKGNTGSGKTTIFDAMTFALYGGSSGENEKSKTGRNDLKEWRCTQADKTLDTIVSFTFSVRDRKYVFKRSLIQKTKNLSEKYEAGEMDEEGNVIPFFDNPKKDELNKKAEELVGLTKEQFRQVVLLPQGQFERFLTASSSEKEEILQKIFDSGQWAKYAWNFFNNAQERKKALDDEKKEIHTSLEEESVIDLAALEEKIQLLQKEREETENTHIAFNGEQKQINLEADIVLAESFKPLHDAEKILTDLKEQKTVYEANKKTYEQAEQAEFLRELIANFEKAFSDRDERQKELRNIQTGMVAAIGAEETSRIAKEEHSLNSPVEEWNKTLGIYESKKSVYGEVEGLRNDAKQAEKELKKAQTEFKKAKESDETALEEAKSAKKAADEADGIAKAYRDKYYAGIYGEIADSLEDGKKCPVCGSLEHPEPAEKSPDSVSKEEVDEKEALSEEAEEKWKKAEEKREKAETEKNQKQNIQNEKDGLKKEADAKLKAAEKNLIEGIADSKALTDEIKEIRKNIEKYTEESRTLETTWNQAVQKLNELKGKIGSAEQEKEKAENNLEKAQADLENALKEKGYENYEAVKALLVDAEERNRMHTELVAYDTSCKVAEENLEKHKNDLKGKIEPDASQFVTRKKEIDDEIRDYTKKASELEQEIERLSNKQKNLAKKAEHYNANIIEAGNDLAFAKKLRGDTGIGLQRYVLAIMFNQVIGEANQMLAKVHGGRYYLFRSDDKGAGNKKGLELKVHDNRSPEREGRSVAMLSGGEKFLVSLALSIGMSTVAQKSGVQIEALFIDEGFGTLDDSSINDAMDVLDSVRKGNGMIGIISHVQLLEANIPAHLEVIKSETGSRIVMD